MLRDDVPSVKVCGTARQEHLNMKALLFWAMVKHSEAQSLAMRRE